MRTYFATTIAAAIAAGLLAPASATKNCQPCKPECKKSSVTRVSGSAAPKGKICSGQLIFEDNFDKFNLKTWQHEQTLGGGGNWEFQWYNNNRTNSYVENGTLFIKPTLLADERGEKFLYSGTLDVNGGAPADHCTNPLFYGCIRQGNSVNILNPIKSARIRTVDSFSFCYGKLEVRAKLPKGDWLWPAIWMLPTYNQYSSWPASGEIDIMESRGNQNLTNAKGESLGVNVVASTLHWGPNPQTNRYYLTTYSTKPGIQGYDEDFHKYQMEWSPENITFSVDGNELATITPPPGGFWEKGDFKNMENIWRSGNKMAPFDQEFHIVINLAVGGVAFFPDNANNPGGKPWMNNSTRAASDFWEGRAQWLPTWDLETDKSALKIDYVKVWAL